MEERLNKMRHVLTFVFPFEGKTTQLRPARVKKSSPFGGLARMYGTAYGVERVSLIGCDEEVISEVEIWKSLGSFQECLARTRAKALNPSQSNQHLSFEENCAVAWADSSHFEDVARYTAELGITL